MSEKVNHPKHYKTDRFECIEVMRDVFGLQATQNFCLLNVFKYLWRDGKKEGTPDILKAKWYFEKFFELDDEWDKANNLEAESEDSEEEPSPFDNLIKNIGNMLEQVVDRVEKYTDPESEYTKRYAYFKKLKNEDYDEDISFLLATNGSLEDIEDYLREVTDEQPDENTGKG